MDRNVPSSAKKPASTVPRTPNNRPASSSVPRTPMEGQNLFASSTPSTPASKKSDGSAMAQFVEKEIKTIHGMFFTYDKKEQEWEDRIKGLQAVSKLVGNEEAIHASNFHQLFESVLSEDINHQLADPRSAVVKESCKTITDIVIHLGEARAKNFVLRAMPLLYSNLVKTKQIFRDCAHACILSIVQNFVFPSICTKILDGYNDKHHLLREKCAEYLCKGIQKCVTDSVSLEAEFETILNSLKVRLGDSQPVVREWSRKTMVSLREINAARIQLFTSSLDAPLQKQLETAFNAKPVPPKFASSAKAPPAVIAAAKSASAALPADSILAAGAQQTAPAGLTTSGLKQPAPARAQSAAKFREFLKAKAAAGASPVKAASTPIAEEFFIDFGAKAEALSAPAVAAPAPEEKNLIQLDEQPIPESSTFAEATSASQPASLLDASMITGPVTPAKPAPQVSAPALLATQEESLIDLSLLAPSPVRSANTATSSNVDLLVMSPLAGLNMAGSNDSPLLLKSETPVSTTKKFHIMTAEKTGHSEEGAQGNSRLSFGLSPIKLADRLEDMTTIHHGRLSSVLSASTRSEDPTVVFAAGDFHTGMDFDDLHTRKVTFTPGSPLTMPSPGIGMGGMDSGLDPEDVGFGILPSAEPTVTISLAPSAINFGDTEIIPASTLAAAAENTTANKPSVTFAEEPTQEQELVQEIKAEAEPCDLEGEPSFEMLPQPVSDVVSVAPDSAQQAEELIEVESYAEEATTASVSEETDIAEVAANNTEPVIEQVSELAMPRLPTEVSDVEFSEDSAMSHVPSEVSDVEFSEDSIAFVDEATSEVDNVNHSLAVNVTSNANASILVDEELEDDAQETSPSQKDEENFAIDISFETPVDGVDASFSGVVGEIEPTLSWASVPEAEVETVLFEAPVESVEQTESDVGDTENDSQMVLEVDATQPQPSDALLDTSAQPEIEAVEPEIEATESVEPISVDYSVEIASEPATVEAFVEETGPAIEVDDGVVPIDLLIDQDTSSDRVAELLEPAPEAEAQPSVEIPAQHVETDLPTELVVESEVAAPESVADVYEPAVEPSTESVPTESVADQSMPSVPEPSVDTDVAVAEPIESSVENVVEFPTQVDVEPSEQCFEPLVDSAAEPLVDLTSKNTDSCEEEVKPSAEFAVAEVAVDQHAESASEPVVEPTSESTVESASESIVLPVSEPSELAFEAASGSVVEVSPESMVEPSELVVEGTSESASESVVEPAASEPAVESVFEPASDATVESAFESIVEPASEPSAEPASEPVIEFSQEVETEENVEPSVDAAVESVALAAPRELELDVEPTEVIEPTSEQTETDPAVEVGHADSNSVCVDESTTEKAVEQSIVEVVESTTELAAEPVESIVEPIIEPTIEFVAESTVVSSSEPTVEAVELAFEPTSATDSNVDVQLASEYHVAAPVAEAVDFEGDISLQPALEDAVEPSAAEVAVEEIASETTSTSEVPSETVPEVETQAYQAISEPIVDESETAIAYDIAAPSIGASSVEGESVSIPADDVVYDLNVDSSDPIALEVEDDKVIESEQFTSLPTESSDQSPIFKDATVDVHVPSVDHEVVKVAFEDSIAAEANAESVVSQPESPLEQDAVSEDIVTNVDPVAAVAEEISISQSEIIAEVAADNSVSPATVPTADQDASESKASVTKPTAEEGQEPLSEEIKEEALSAPSESKAEAEVVDPTSVPVQDAQKESDSESEEEVRPARGRRTAARAKPARRGRRGAQAETVELDDEEAIREEPKPAKRAGARKKVEIVAEPEPAPSKTLKRAASRKQVAIPEPVETAPEPAPEPAKTLKRVASRKQILVPEPVEPAPEPAVEPTPEPAPRGRGRRAAAKVEEEEVAEEPVAKKAAAKRAGRGRAAAPADETPKVEEVVPIAKEPETKKVAAKRAGRGRAVEEAPAQPVKVEEETAEVPKKRGRPARNAVAPVVEEAVEAPEPEPETKTPAAKRAGRGRAAKEEPEPTPAETTTKPAAKGRGRRAAAKEEKEESEEEIEVAPEPEEVKPARGRGRRAVETEVSVPTKPEEAQAPAPAPVPTPTPAPAKGRRGAAKVDKNAPVELDKENNINARQAEEPSAAAKSSRIKDGATPFSPVAGRTRRDAPKRK